MFNMSDPIQWAFLQNYYLDKSNACVHCAPVRFSPLTFRLHAALVILWSEDEHETREMAEVAEHVGLYEEDKGR